MKLSFVLDYGQGLSANKVNAHFFSAASTFRFALGEPCPLPAGSSSISTLSNYGAIDNLQTITGQSEALYRRDTWKKIDAATLDLRRKMVKKYNVEF